jgi:hypothetical protein
MIKLQCILATVEINERKKQGVAESRYFSVPAFVFQTASGCVTHFYCIFSWPQSAAIGLEEQF